MNWVLDLLSCRSYLGLLTTRNCHLKSIAFDTLGISSNGIGINLTENGATPAPSHQDFQYWWPSNWAVVAPRVPLTLLNSSSCVDSFSFDIAIFSAPSCSADSEGHFRQCLVCNELCSEDFLCSITVHSVHFGSHSVIFRYCFNCSWLLACPFASECFVQRTFVIETTAKRSLEQLHCYPW